MVKPIIFGAIWFIPLFFLQWLLKISFPTEYQFSSLYLYVTLYGSLLPFAIAVAGYIISFRMTAEPVAVLKELLVYFTSYFTLINIADLIWNYDRMSTSVLFLEPIARIMIAILIAVFIAKVIDTYGWLKAVWIFLSILVLFILPFSEVVFWLGQPAWAWVIAAVSVAASVTGFYFIKQSL
ncbi:MAG: hypothetical protein ACLFR1_10635 [Spirochaetia bacterium]